MPRRALGPAALVLAAVVVIWVTSGVGIGDVLKFLGYEIAFVMLPGAALLWALRGRPSFIHTIALGWPLGQALEILAFSGTAAISMRGLYVAYPIVVVVASGFWIWRRSGGPPDDAKDEAMSTRVMWALAAVVTLGLAYVCLDFLPTVPLPSLARTVSYYVDFPNFIGLTAEVRNHWPPTSPGLSGVPLHYEWFVFYQMAAINQVTGIAIPTIAFRLDFVPTIIVIGCELFILGRYISRNAWVGVFAVGVAFLLGQLDLTTDAAGTAGSPFFDSFSYHLWASWTFPFGLTFFLALMFVITERLQAPTWRTAADLGSWALMALLMIGASGAKATVLPVVIGGTGLYVIAVFAIRRTIPANALLVLGLAIVVFVATFAVIYGGGVPGTVVEPIASLKLTVPVTVTETIHHSILRHAILPFAFVAALAGQLLPFAGALYLLRKQHRAQIARYMLCVCIMVTGVMVASLFHQVGYSEIYFQDTAYGAGFVVAAGGLYLAWTDIRSMGAWSARAVVVAFAGWAALILAISAVTTPTPTLGGVVVRYAAIAIAGVAFITIVVRYATIRGLCSPGVLLVGLLPLTAASALSSPIQQSPTIGRVLTGRPITITQPDPQVVRGLTPGILLALQWMQNHTSVDTVFAVSNHWINAAGTDGRDQYYSGFSERQFFVESYNPDDYGITVGISTPAEVNFLYRVQLNDAVFEHANAGALTILTHQYGVRYLLIDRIHGGADTAVLALGRVVFSDRDATIVAVG